MNYSLHQSWGAFTQEIERRYDVLNKMLNVSIEWTNEHMNTESRTHRAWREPHVTQRRLVWKRWSFERFAYDMTHVCDYVVFYMFEASQVLRLPICKQTWKIFSSNTSLKWPFQSIQVVFMSRPILLISLGAKGRCWHGKNGERLWIVPAYPNMELGQRCTNESQRGERIRESERLIVHWHHKETSFSCVDTSYHRNVQNLWHYPW